MSIYYNHFRTTTFTPETGIRVKFSIMPDESKLVLANAAGIQPDVALGVSTNIPFELAIRNALKDLRSFDDFDAYIRVFHRGISKLHHQRVSIRPTRNPRLLGDFLSQGYP